MLRTAGGEGEWPAFERCPLQFAIAEGFATNYDRTRKPTTNSSSGILINPPR
jgi:hypothetical protein